MSDYDERMASAKAVERELYGEEVDPGMSKFEADCLLEDTGIGTETESERILTLTREIKEYKQTAGDAILEIGKRLKEAKSLLSHGEWLPWLNEKVEFSERAAQRFMQLAEEYSNPTALSDLGATKALQLLALNPIERDEFLATKHEVDGQEKTVAEMSSRELDKALRERDEALEAKKAAEEKARTAEGQSAAMKTKLDTALSAANDLEIQRAAAETKSKELSEKLKAERDRVKEAKATAENARQELEELKKKPIDVAVQQPSEETMEKLKADAEAAAEEKVKAAEAALAEAQNRASAAEQEAAKARKQLELADKATTAFQFFYEEWQHKYNAMLGALMQVGDAEKRDKLKVAIRAAVQKMGDQV